MTALGLRLLGDFEARDAAGRPFVVAARKNRALLAALALAPSCSMPRERLATLLWSDRGEAQAQGSLRQALVALRKDLAAVDLPLLSANNERVTLDPARVEVDAVEFQRLAASNDAEALRRAAALYRGELLADTDIRDPAYEDWVGSQRRRLSDVAIDVLEKLCAQETGRARIEIAKRLVALDPFMEASHRTLMQAYSEAGEKGLALRQYEVCRDALRDELDVVPGEETEALRHRLLNTLIKRDEAVVAGAGNAARLEARPALDDKCSIAVLPFDVMTGDAELNDFSDGLTEDIITGLSRIKAIRVVARNITFTYKGRSVDIRSVGRELGVRYVLEGSVRKSGARMRISAQLIDAANGHHIWAERVDRADAEIFDLQDEITSGIVASVQTQLILSEGKAAATGDQSAESARRLLARSWQQFLGLTARSLAECRSLAERALLLDADSGLGHRMVAVSLYHQAYMGYIPWTEQVLDDIYAHAKISIEAEDADEYSHWAMACAHLLRMEHERGVASLRRALDINPNCSLAHGSIGTNLAWSGRSDASIKSNELAIRINPDDPSIFFRHFGLALAHYLASRYDQALVHANAALQMRPGWWLPLIVYCASLAQIGRRDEARRMLDELRRGRSGMPCSLGILPFASAHDREHLLDGLRLAGLPD